MHSIVVAITLTVTLSSPSDPWGASPQLGPRAAEQIVALMREKGTRTAAQQKVDSRILLEIEKRWPSRLAVDPFGRQGLATGIEATDGDRIGVDLEGVVSDRLLREIERVGGVIELVHAELGSLRFRAPLSRLVELAELPEVARIVPARRAQLQMINTTEGDVAHGTDVVRSNLGLTGAGVRVGVLSDGVDALAAVQASGDLPGNVTVLPGQAGSGGSAGTAMLEIIHDLAPAAELFFATAQGGTAQMAQNIRDLAAAGCQILVDDFLYFAEPAFQDGVVAEAVDEVAAQGVLFFSALTNSGNLNSGTAGVWEGPYEAAALPPALTGLGLTAHDFDASAAVASSNLVTEQALAPAGVFTLQWADPWGASGNDYDLFLLSGDLDTVLAASTNTQNGDDLPFELLVSPDDDSGNRLVIVQSAGDDVFVRVNTHRGLLEYATAGQIYGHAAAEGAAAVAAVDVATANGGQFTGGSANPVEPFSSDGPRRIFFESDGTPVGGGRRGEPTSVVRQKPDLAAADGVSTATPGFDPFFGTSASAPHSAGIAALYKELFPSISGDTAMSLFDSTALDIEDVGFDRDSGNGIMMLEPSIDNTLFADGFESGDATSWTSSTP